MRFDLLRSHFYFQLTIIDYIYFMNTNQRFNQLEELMSNLTRNVDKLSADMSELRQYVLDNNQVVNSILRKLDDHSEMFERNDEHFKKMDKRFEKNEVRFKKMDERFEKNDERFRKMDERFEKHEQILSKMMDEMTAERKLRDAQFEYLLKRSDN